MEATFEYDGRPGHEIVLLYEGVFVDPALYRQDEMQAHEHDGSPLRVLWKSLDSFDSERAPLYPEGLIELLRGER